MKRELALPAFTELVFADLAARRARLKASSSAAYKALLSTLTKELETNVPIDEVAAGVKTSVSKRVALAVEARAKAIDANYAEAKLAKRSARMYGGAAAALVAVLVLQWILNFISGLVFGRTEE